MNHTRYAIVFLGVAVGVALIVAAINNSGQTTLGSQAQLMVPAMIAALVEGQCFVRAKNRKPTSAERWGFVWIATAICVVLNVALSYFAGSLLPVFAKLAIAPLFSQQFNVLIGIYAGAYLICNWFFVAIGVSTEQAAIERRNNEDGS